MKPNALFIALVLAAGSFSVTALAQPASDATAKVSPLARLDANGDGAVDRDEAAAQPRLAAHFDRLDRNGDGKLDASELRRNGGMRGKRQGPRGRAGGVMGHAGLHGIARLDGDGDGRISRAELEQAGQRETGQTARRGMRDSRGGHAWLLENFDIIDVNSDGYIVRSELQAWQQVRREMRQEEMRERFDARFAAADTNGDGKLSRDEVKQHMPHLESAFAWMDDNRDGYLDRDEIFPRRGN